jgi:hypothetical protein
MSEVLIVVATVVMAIFSGLSWYVSAQIKKDGAARDAEVRELIIKLTAGIMASGAAAGEGKIAAGLFQRNPAESCDSK